MGSKIFDIEALEKNSRLTEGNVTFLPQPDEVESNNTLEVFDFIPEEPLRPRSLDDEPEPKILAAIGEWGTNALNGLDGSYSADERGRSLAFAGGAATVLAVGAVILPEVIK